MIILNTLYKGDVSKFEINDFYSYLNYLSSIGISKELIRNFYTMYSEENTLNLYYLLDELSDKYNANKTIYKAKKD